MGNPLYSTWAWQTLSRKTIARGRTNQEPCCRCGGWIDYRLNGRHRDGPTADHLDPLAHGGPQLPPLHQLGVAHRHCNSRHGATISNQTQGLGPGSRGGNPDNYSKRRRRTGPSRYATTNKCEWCGCTFQPWMKSPGRYCSIECRADARTTERWAITWIAECANCGKPISQQATTRTDPAQQQPTPPARHTCSTECSTARHAQQAAIRSRDKYRASKPAADRQGSRHPDELRPAAWRTASITPVRKPRECRHKLNRETEIGNRKSEIGSESKSISSHSESPTPRKGEVLSLPDFPQESGRIALMPGNSALVAAMWADGDESRLWGLRPRPEVGVWPRLMTAPHPDAVGSYGPEFLAWAAARPGMHPKRSAGHRWWQELVAHRALEHDAQGRLCWRTIVLTLSRQVGKSWLLRELCLWRLSLAERMGEVQTVVHAADKLPHAYGVWQWAALWAMRQPALQVRWANGEQRIMAPDRSVWQIHAANDGLGASLSVSLALVDEGWNIPLEVVDNSLAPTQAEAEQPQLWLVSTAGGKTGSAPVSPLIPTYRATAMAGGSVLLLEWSAPRSADIDAPEVWRMASPHWDGRRVAVVADARSKAAAEVQVEAFRRQWLNQWPEGDAATAAGWVDAQEWELCAVDGLGVPAGRGVVGLALDEVDGSWPVVVANRVAAGVGVRLVGVYGSQGEAEAAAAEEAAGKGVLLLTPQHGLRGQVHVRGVRESLHFHEGDVASALALCRVWVGRRELVYPAGDGIGDAVLGVPGKREYRRYSGGVLGLVCAWWAHKHRPTAAAA